jgi:hypothetical protein
MVMADKRSWSGSVAEVSEPRLPESLLHAAEGDAALPALDDPYQAIGNASGDREVELCVILGQAEKAAGREVYRFFEYQHLASDTGLAFAQDGSHIVRLRFIAPHAVTLVIEGDNLLRAAHLIHKHRITWIRRFDREREFPRLEVDGGKKPELIRSVRFLYDDPRDDPANAGVARTLHDTAR